MYQQEHGLNMPRLVGAAQTVTSGTQDAVSNTFTASGTLTTAEFTSEVTYLVVGGGGAGGSTNAGGFEQGGGGGAGGFRTGPAPVTGGSPYPIVVGAGGAASAGSSANGVASSAVGITSAGGGLGAYNAVNAGDGGSGGGAANFQPNLTGGSGNTPPVSPSQGNNGGTLPGSIAGDDIGSAGGGGAGGTGYSRGEPPHLHLQLVQVVMVVMAYPQQLQVQM
jgi:hypothetical protein